MSDKERSAHNSGLKQSRISLRLTRAAQACYVNVSYCSLAAWILAFACRVAPPVAPAPRQSLDSRLFCGGTLRTAEYTVAPRTEPSRGEPARIQARIREHYGELRACYSASLSRDPQAAGSTLMRFVIAKDGSVHDVCVEQSSLEDNQALACMVAEYQRLVFEPVGRTITVVYPLVFRPR
jgi:hypothetical protein